MSEQPPCDQDVFKNGQSIIVLNARSVDAEEWVCAVRAMSGQQVDWYYSGGRANVLYIGDRARVEAAIDALLPTLRGSVLSYTAPGERGPYRAGDHLPAGVIAVG